MPDSCRIWGGDAVEVPRQVNPARYMPLNLRVIPVVDCLPLDWVGAGTEALGSDSTPILLPPQGLKLLAEAGGFPW